MKGDCLTCARLGPCTETSVKKVLESYTCPLYEPVFEEVYLARIEMMKKYGEETALKAMIGNPLEAKGEEEENENH